MSTRSRDEPDAGRGDPDVARLRLVLVEHEPTASVLELDRLVARLSASIDALLGRVDEQWREELRSLWRRLEHVNAVALAADRHDLVPAELEAVGAACDELRALLKQY